jgi:hypothetical protein
MQLLEVLVKRPGELLSKDELLDAAWPGVVVEENNLQAQVSVLRKLLGAAAIATVTGRGYRFALPVMRSTASVRAQAGSADGDGLLGRDHEFVLLQSQLRSARLVTITGAGGVGKTRLARATVRAGDGRRVSWVDLAELNGPTPCSTRPSDVSSGAWGC